MKKSINKKRMIRALALAFGLYIICPRIPASAAETGTGTVSAGRIVYENSAGSIVIDTKDIALLKEKLSGVRAEIYDPASYGHVHQWKYTDITESTHTERCLQCGSSAELVTAHAAASSEKCVIAYDGKTYPGKRYLCACGFEWTRERYHSPVYSPIGSLSHAVSCALQGTAYCSGMGEIEGEHISALHPTDETHHRAVCEYCNYEGAETACVFDREDPPDENASVQSYRYCECGNRLIEEEAQPDLPDEPEEEPPASQEEKSEEGTKPEEEPPASQDEEPEEDTQPEEEPPASQAEEPEKGTQTEEEPPAPLEESEETVRTGEETPISQKKETENKGGNV